ncbi:trehalose-phosphatase [Brevundimonas diminuta]|uniref:trehalose-phosphatase n=1 Tax=Brevundimonas diminuta TaxID=293 RepID=UPI003D076A59
MSFAQGFAPPVPFALPPVPPLRLEDAALFLDLDGVLAPLASTPEAVGPDPRRTQTLIRLQQALKGRVAVVSGRTLAEIDRIVDGAARAASGVHGLERRAADGALSAREPSPSVRTALAAFQDFARYRPGVLVEDKGLSAGLHFRQAPDEAGAALSLATALADETGLTLQPGSMVLELKTPGADKGAAVAAFMTEAPFAGAMPIMVGDDLTDEAGFRAAEALGGFGVLVGPGRPTAARYRLDDVEAVLNWLGTVSANAARIAEAQA